MMSSALACAPLAYRNIISHLRKVRFSFWKYQGRAAELPSVGKHVGTEWNIYDVGGSRSSRASWAPFFDDMDAIIFLAPVSVFDEKLLEDGRVNRLQDSYELWKQVMTNKVLVRTQVILFLNKYDLLVKKLKRGVRIGDFISSYGERENTPEAAVKCTCLQTVAFPEVLTHTHKPRL